MGKKDWKKIPHYHIWEKKNKYRVAIDKADIYGGWWLTVYNKHTMRKYIQKHFKTKSTALKFAHTYMGKH